MSGLCRFRAKTSAVDTELRPHQSRVLRRIREQPGLVVAHGLGSGKTLTSIAAGEELGGDTAVVAPAALLGNYAKEVDKHVSSPDTRRFLESLQRVGLRKELAAPPGRLLVVDEAHRLRDPASKTRMALAKAAPSFDKTLLLTATPVYNHPHDLAALVNLVSGEPLLPASKGDFSKEYVSSEKVKPGFFARLRGVKPGARQRLTNEKKLGEILGTWVDYHDNPPEGFPSVSYEKVDVPMSDHQHKLYSSFMDTAPAWLRHKVRKGLPPSKAESKQLNAFASATRQVSNTTLPFDAVTPEAEQLAASAKLQRAVGELARRHADDPEYRSVVYSNFLDAGLSPYEKLLQDTKVPYGKFTGGMKRTERDELVRRYNEGDLRALLISSAGGEGLDLKGTRLIQVLDPHWNEEKIRQVIGRGVRYKSHAHLPEEDQNVVVQRYRSTLPERKGLGRLLRGKDRGGSIDTYLSMLSEEKDFLNEQVRALMRQETARRS